MFQRNMGIKMKKTLWAVALSTLAMAGQYAQAASPSLAGQTVEAYVGSVNEPIERFDDFGTFAPFVVEDGPDDRINFGDVFTLDVDGDGFTVTFYAHGNWGSDTALHIDGLAFTDEQGQASGGLAGVTLTSNLGDLPVTWTPSSIKVDMSGLNVATQSYFSGKFVVSSVPEPSALLMSVMGIAAMAAVFRRRALKSE